MDKNIKETREKLGSLPFGDWVKDREEERPVTLVRGASNLVLECISRPETAFYRGMFDMALATWGTNEFENKWIKSDALTRFYVIWDVLHGKVGGHALESPSWSFIVRGMPRHGFDQDRTSRVGSVWGSSGLRDNARILDSDFILYPSLYDDEETREKIRAHLTATRELYKYLVQHKLESYQDARAIAPMCYHHPYTVQRNLRAWLFFFSGRACFSEEFAVNGMAWLLREFFLKEGYFMIADVMKPRCDHAKKCLSTNPYYAALFRGCGRWPEPEESKGAASFDFVNTSKKVQEECLGIKIPTPELYMDITRDEGGFGKLSSLERKIFEGRFKEEQK